MLGSLASCAKPSATFPDQAKADLDPRRIGHIAADLQPVAGKDGAWSTQSESQVFYASASDDETCIRMTVDEQLLESHTSVEQEVAEYETMGQAIQVAFGAYDALDKLPASETFPPLPTNTKYQLVGHRVETHPFKHSDGTTTETQRLFVTFEWCAPRPAVKATSRYVTATMYSADKRALYAWAIDGAPNVSSGAGSGSSEATPE